MRISAKNNQKFHYSPLRYPGGKTFLFPFFADLIEKKGLRKVTYVEPFAGGAGAALSLLLQNRVDRIIINDLDNAIYSFWRSAVFHSNEFIDKIFATPVTVEEWRKQKEIFSDSRSGLFEKGFATFFLNRTNVSGNLDGGPIGGLDQNGKWRIDARFYRETLAKRIREIALRKDRIVVTNKDGRDLIKESLRRKNSFIYIDPPYYEKGATLYLNYYDRHDHELLADLLNRNAGAFWSLTYDDRKEIRSLYSRRSIVSFSLNYVAYESRRGREVMILSDALSTR